MNKAVMKKWVKYLRGGKYKQGQNYLKYFNKKNEPRHCCLGVLCELYNDEMKKQHKKMLETHLSTDDIDIPNGHTRFNETAGELPEKVRKWAEMTTNDGVFDINKESLAGLNDKGKKFSTIADIIEDNYESL